MGVREDRGRHLPDPLCHAPDRGADGEDPVIARKIILSGLALFLLFACAACSGGGDRFPSEKDRRMAWWREARFGLFIHWGLYSIPAGQWEDETDHAEWIMTTAQIPVEEYEQLLERFDPLAFDADAWVRMAKAAGMRYIVITTKHHDGFALFDSQVSDYDVMATPFGRDIMAELAEACRRHGLEIGWYHSIMDWHHPDYLPRRGWEERPAEGADFDRYVAYLRAQVTELLTDYGDIGVMWFDGEWESTWSHEYGQPLYELCRELQPDVIVNNRVDVGRGGMEGISTDDRSAGDFGTPEQQVPDTGLPGIGNEPVRARLLADPDSAVPVERVDTDLILTLPGAAPDADCSVAVLEVRGEPLVYEAPSIEAPAPILVRPIPVTLSSRSVGLQLRYTLDGTDPGAGSTLYEGPFTLSLDDVYRFTLVSDDGSRLLIDEQLVVDNDGLHGSQGRTGTVALAAGPHALVVEWFNKTGGADLDLFYGPAGDPLERVPAGSLGRVPAPGSPPDRAAGCGG